MYNKNKKTFKRKNMSEKKENIIKRTCKELGITQKKYGKRLKAIRTIVLEVGLNYIKSELSDIKLTEIEIDELLKQYEYLNKFDSEDTVKLRELFMSQLKDDIVLLEDGTQILNNFELLPKTNIFEKQKTPQLLTGKELNIVTPKYLKDFCKSNKWTYKDLAEAIGSVEGTIKVWMSKGDIPLWAKRSILYIAMIEKLELEKQHLNEEKDFTNEILENFKNLLFPSK